MSKQYLVTGRGLGTSALHQGVGGTEEAG